MDLVAWAAREAELRLSPLGSRWAHTQAVAARAQSSSGHGPGGRPASCSSRRRTCTTSATRAELADSGFHPLDGARWLRAQGQERLACLVAHHSAARFEARGARARGCARGVPRGALEHRGRAELLRPHHRPRRPAGDASGAPCRHRRATTVRTARSFAACRPRPLSLLRSSRAPRRDSPALGIAAA